MKFVKCFITERDERFVGRRDELSDVIRSLDPELHEGSQIVCLHGEAGMGRTAVAIAATRRMTEWFDEIICLSGSPESPDDLRRHILSILRSLDNTGHKLLVLDSVEMPDLIGRMRDDLPENCSALITGREALEIDGKQIHIGPMSHIDSIHLINAYGAERNLRASPEQMDEIINFAGSNPMVMRMVVSQVTDPGKTLDEVLEDLRATEGKISDHIFSRSLELAGSDGRDIFTLLSVFLPTASRKALQSVCDLKQVEFEKAIKRVAGLSLIESYDQGRRFGLHQLALDELKRRSGGDAAVEKYRERAAQFFKGFVNATAPMTRPEIAAKALGAQMLEGRSARRIQDAAIEIFVKPAMRMLEAEIYNCRMAIEWLLSKDKLDEANDLVNNLSDFLITRGYWDTAADYLRRLAEGWHKRGQYHAEAIALSNMGMLYSRQKQWIKAASTSLESFQIAVSVHSSVVIDSLRNILDVSKDMLESGEFAIPAQLAEQLSQIIKSAQVDDDEMKAALAISHGVLTIISFMAACELNRESGVYSEALELASILDEKTGSALNLLNWLGVEETG